MEEPHGLSIDQSTLFICDGNAGLKVYNKEDPLNIDKSQLAHFRDIHAYDVIAFGDVLMLIGEDGLHQYDHSDVKNIQFLSTIPVVKD